MLARSLKNWCDYRRHFDPILRSCRLLRLPAQQPVYIVSVRLAAGQDPSVVATCPKSAALLWTLRLCSVLPRLERAGGGSG